MSLTSIKINDSGYTPPDFIQTLFKPFTTTTIPQSDTGSVKSIESLPRFQSFVSYQHPLREKQNPRLSPTKLVRTTSVINEDRAMIRKLKIFYQSEMENIKKQFEIQEQWRKFEQSLQNPFAFDKFIEEIRMRHLDTEISQNKIQLNLKDLQIQKQQPKSLSVPKKTKTNAIQSDSLTQRKVKKSKEQRKKEMRNSIQYLRKIMVHGDNFIKDK